MTLQVDPSKGCTYEVLPSGIHVFTFTGKSPTALDEFFVILTNLLATTDPSVQVLRYIVDVTDASGQAPINEMVRRFQRLETALPQRPRGRTAIIHQGNVFLSLANTLLGALAPAGDVTRFFNATEREQAMRWLLETE